MNGHETTILVNTNCLSEVENILKDYQAKNNIMTYYYDILS